jgi:Ca-activated chloride channel homolog
MAYGRPATVRSHRRGGPRRRLNVAPWIVISLVVLLVAGGLTAGFVWLIKQSCSGEVRATVVASPATASILESLNRQWSATEPSIDGTCVAIDIRAKDSADVALALQNTWDPKADGPAPDAWVPQSTAWVRKASDDADAEILIPDLQPSIARSPAVIAMPKAMAEKLGWPKPEVSWESVIEKALAKTGWDAHGEPGWGPFRFGMTNPATSTAGLLALTAILDADDNEVISSDEQLDLYQLQQVMAVYAERTDEIFEEYARLASQSPEDGLKYVSAFPALEQDVLNHNLRYPEAPLVALYPAASAIEADHPYLVLRDPPWARPDSARAASAFMNFVRGPSGEQQLLDAGFRDPNRVPGRDLTVQNGVAKEITVLPRAVLLPESVGRTINTWTELTRSANILLVLDVSGSMNDPVPGSGGTRMDLAKKAAKQAVQLFRDDARVGLWVFSSELNGNRDHRTVVPLDVLSNPAENGETRRDQMLRSIDQIQAAGWTGLYDTVAAAQRTVRDNYQKDAVNLVVVMTDGKNEDESGGLSLAQLRQRIGQISADADRRVPIATVGFGAGADYGTLRQISQLAGGLAFESREEFDIDRVLVDAIFSDY